MIAQATGLARIAISDGEAEQLAAAGANVAQYYDMPVIAPEALAWCGLIQALAIVYGGRILAARAEAAQAREAARHEARAQRTAPNGSAPHVPEGEPVPMQTINMGGVEYEIPKPGTGH